MTHPTELFEVFLDVLEGGGRREAADENFLCASHHLQRKKTGLEQV